jgi:hypothetical protein
MEDSSITIFHKDYVFFKRVFTGKRREETKTRRGKRQGRKEEYLVFSPSTKYSMQLFT